MYPLQRRGDCCRHSEVTQIFSRWAMIQIQTVSIFYILNLSSMLIFDSLLRYCVIYKSFNCSLQFMENGCLEDSEIRSELSENFIVFVRLLWAMRMESRGITSFLTLYQTKSSRKLVSSMLKYHSLIFYQSYKMQLYEKCFSCPVTIYIFSYDVQYLLYMNSYDKFFKDLISEKSFLMIWYTSISHWELFSPLCFLSA